MSADTEKKLKTDRSGAVRRGKPMMFEWRPDMIHFMRDASEYGDYNERLAELIAPYLPKNAQVCDAGCGLGYLSLALSRYAARVTAVDIRADALTVLRENLEKRGVNNISIRLGSVPDAPPKTPYDAMVFCFYGGGDEVLDIARRQCRGSVIMLKRNYATHRFSIGEYPLGADSLAAAKQRLEELGVAYESRELSLELGQPFRTMAEAESFFRLYSRDEDKSAITPEFLQTRLVETGREDFPLYLPHKREIGWIYIENPSQ